MHRPHVSGMHGRDSDGAYSIVLAGGYEDDTVFTSSSDPDALSHDLKTCSEVISVFCRMMAKSLHTLAVEGEICLVTNEQLSNLLIKL